MRMSEQMDKNKKQTLPLGDAKNPKELANTLRKLAEMTAAHSQNWDNYEQILVDVFEQVQQALEEE